ncbi:uncharacterized protein LOC129219136 [Uloborus diversus]|uniref:uncharacterized protein LOC129219136 n=1 Tax=Uloborus diversus TaxID=327109 RepID=UPI002409A2E7|nr:uncharacterized protein LOC129219136 [Uloborus diversus]
MVLKIAILVIVACACLSVASKEAEQKPPESVVVVDNHVERRPIPEIKPDLTTKEPETKPVTHTAENGAKPIPEKQKSPAQSIENHTSEHQNETEIETEPKVEARTEHKDEMRPAAQQSGGRQFAPMYQPIFPPPSGFNMIRRQLGGGMEILGDIVMMGMIGLPILGLLTVGSSSIANFLGFGSNKSTSKRSKRSLKEKAAGAVEYAKNLWDVMEELEKAFEKYGLYQAECRTRAMCEAHQKTPRMGNWGQTLLDLMRKQKELENREILPVSRFLFSNYVEAAQVGMKGEDCGVAYPECAQHLAYYTSDKADEVENEIHGPE